MVRAIGSLALVTVLLGGCGKAVTGTARPNQAEADKISAARYEDGIKAFRGYFDRVRDGNGKLYNYLRFGGKKRDREFDATILGNPPAILIKQHDGEPGYEYDQFHPAGSDLDYVRLGDKHAHLAPTRWVSFPTAYPKGTPVSACLTLVGFAGCHLKNAIAQTKLDAPDRQPRTARATGDGVEIDSGITLNTAMAENLIVPPEDIANQIGKDMKDTVLPVRIELGPDNEFRGFEIRATVSGGSLTLEVQLGYEVTGKAEKSDFPDIPPANEITALTDKAAIDKLWDGVTREH
jgi:hypothetical protein